MLVRMTFDVATRKEQARLTFISTKKRRDGGTPSALVKERHQWQRKPYATQALRCSSSDR